MKPTRIAAVSMNGMLGEPEAVLERMAAFCAQAAAEEVKLVLFPELVIHGHCTPNTWEIAEAVPDGPSVRRLIAMADEYQITLSAGLSEKENDLVFNTQVLVSPEGYLGKQRKLHLSRDEGLHYKGGREIAVFDIGPCRVGTIICYDNQFPEIARICALRGADVLLMPHAAREARWDDSPGSQQAAREHMRDYFTSCYAQRARENACFCVLADQAGVAGYVDSYPREHPNQPHHAGAALVFAPDGRLLKSAQTEVVQDEMIIVELDPQLLAAARSHPNYTLKVRRPELFGELTKEQVRW